MEEGAEDAVVSDGLGPELKKLNEDDLPFTERWSHISLARQIQLGIIMVSRNIIVLH